MEEFGHDLDSAIKSLNKLRLGYVEGELHSVVEAHARGKNGILWINVACVVGSQLHNASVFTVH